MKLTPGAVNYAESDPHRWGYGKIQIPSKVSLPPPPKPTAGILGVQPGLGTRGKDLVEGSREVGEEAGDVNPCGFIRSTRLGFGAVSTSSSSSSSSSPKRSIQECIQKFVGFFLPQQQKVKSYAAAVRAESAPVDMVYPVANRGGGSRDGFGAGRMGRGAGRTGGRNVWQRTDRGRGRGREEDSDLGENRLGSGWEFGNQQRNSGEGGKNSEQAEIQSGGNTSTTNWDQAAGSGKQKDLSAFESNRREQDESRVNKDLGLNSSSGDRAGRNGDSAGFREVKNPQTVNSKMGCGFCGLKNHATGDCKRRNACELCGFNNHGSYECRREPLWSLGPELCAAQVYNQSFFFIDEHIDQKAVKEKANTAIITVNSGELSARQLESEFKSIVNDHVWRWSAKQVADNKFIMRFPNAKMVQDFSKFKLGMKDVEAQITIEPWSSAMGAKGKLQQAWFKVKGIPSDQRSIRTIAKVGGLVGKTVKIDESTRFNNDFVRINIACRDINEVPESAECSLGLFIYDFFYELEEPDVMVGGKQQQGVRIDHSEMQPSPKKQKTDVPKPSAGKDTPKQTSSSIHNTGKCVQTAKFGFGNSAPAKIRVGGKRASPEKVVLHKEGVDDDEIIPAATYEPGESSEEKHTQEDEGSENEFISGTGCENIWLARCEMNHVNQDESVFVMKAPAPQKSSVVISELDENTDSQEGGQSVADIAGEKVELNVEELVNPCAQIAGDRVKRRWSERIHKELEGKAKAGFEDDNKTQPGLYTMEVQGKILDGVKIMLACAHRVLARQPASTLPLLPAAPGDGMDADDEQ